MKRLLFLLPVLFFIKASAQVPYDFKKYRENNLSKDPLKKGPQKFRPLDKVMGKITWSDPNGTFILPLDKNMSETIELMQKLSKKQNIGVLVYTQPNGTKIYRLPQDHMFCLVPDMSQFNMPVFDRGTKIMGMPPGLLPPNEIIPKK